MQKRNCFATFDPRNVGSVSSASRCPSAQPQNKHTKQIRKRIMKTNKNPTNKLHINAETIRLLPCEFGAPSFCFFSGGWSLQTGLIIVIDILSRMPAPVTIFLMIKSFGQWVEEQTTRPNHQTYDDSQDGLVCFCADQSDQNGELSQPPGFD